MKRLLKIKPHEIPLLLAALVFFLALVGWLHYQSRSSVAMVATNMTLNTLQHALEQYVAVTGSAPATMAGHHSIYGFLLRYQRQFSHRTAKGRWVDNRHSAMLFLRPNLIVNGWIPMPHGGRMYGVVAVLDGFGRRIQYVGAHQGSWHGPCFVSPGRQLGQMGHTTIYSTSQAGF